jgi:hypothetical protein
MTAHTPGPWQYENSDETHWIVPDTEVRNGLWCVAQIYGPDVEANARLIAAAPDLLDLAKDIAGLDHRYLAHGDNVLANALREWKAAARTAIAKAEGTS